MHQFCVHCGEKNIYETAPPKFCCGCGNPFNKGISSVKPAVVEQEEDGEVDSKGFNLDKLKKDWHGNTTDAHRETIGGIISTNPNSPRGGSRPMPKSIREADNVVRLTENECAPVKESKELS